MSSTESKLNSIRLHWILQVIEVIRHPVDKAESKYNPEAVSKEDEERYQKMLCENEELQRLIVQVRIRFRYIHPLNSLIS